jgi:hypothetical protein
MNQRLTCLILSFVFLAAVNLYSAVAIPDNSNNNNSTNLPAATFLLVNPSAKSMGMGSAGVALADDFASVHKNPCASVLNPGSEIAINDCSLLTPKTALATFLGFSSKSSSGKFAWGIFLQRADSYDIDCYDEYGNKTGTAEDINNAFGTNISFKLGQTFAIGSTLKYISLDIDGNSTDQSRVKGTGSAIDIGLSYKSSGDRVLAGFSYNNIGPEITQSITDRSNPTITTKEPLPTNIKFGIGFKFLENRNFITLLDFDSGMANNNWKCSTGFEYTLLSMISFRMGVSGGSSYVITPSFGLGFKLGGLLLDFATEQNNVLGNINNFALRYCFVGTQPAAEQKTEPITEPQKQQEPTAAEQIKQAQEAVKPVEQPVQPQQPAAQLQAKKVEDRMNIAVAEFSGRNVSSMEAAIVSDFLRGELVKTEQFNMLDRQNMETLLNEQKFSNVSGCTTEECAVQMGKLLNVKKIITGSLSKLLDKYYITVNVLDVESGKIEYADKDSATNADEISTACERLGLRIGAKYQ